MCKLENLCRFRKGSTVQFGDLLIQWGSINHSGNQYTLIFPIPFKDGTTPAITISPWQYSDIPVHNNRNNKQCPFYSSNRIAIDWIAIGIA